MNSSSGSRGGLWLCVCVLLLAAVLYSGRPEIGDFLSSLPIDIPFVAEAVDDSTGEEENTAARDVPDPEKTVAVPESEGTEIGQAGTPEPFVEIEIADRAEGVIDERTDERTDERPEANEVAVGTDPLETDVAEPDAATAEIQESTPARIAYP
jgi:hypothetical protein